MKTQVGCLSRFFVCVLYCIFCSTHFVVADTRTTVGTGQQNNQTNTTATEEADDTSTTPSLFTDISSHELYDRTFFNWLAEYYKTLALDDNDEDSSVDNDDSLDEQTDSASETESTDGEHEDINNTEEQEPIGDTNSVSYNTAHLFLGGVSAISAQESVFFVAGKDGFVTSYSYPDYIPDTWQLSPYTIAHLAVHPTLPLIAIYETDELNRYQVSLWDWKTKERVFVKQLENNVISLSWSARGTYLFVGDTSVYGIHVYDVNGQDCSVFEVPPGIVALAATAASEKSVLTYSETGSLVYTNLKTQALPTMYQTETKLQKPIILKNFTAIAGYKKNSILFIDALSGKINQTYKVSSEPIFVSQITDTVPIWIERISSTKYSVKHGDAKRIDFSLGTNEHITAALRMGPSILMGTDSGFVYELRESSQTQYSLRQLSVPHFESCVDIKGYKKNVYALTKHALYHADEHELFLTDVVSLSSKIQVDSMEPCEAGIFLWNSKTKESVYFYSFSTRTLTSFFKPKDVVLSISVSGNEVLIAQKHFGCSLFTIQDKKLFLEYPLETIQSAVLVDNTHILIAKNASDLSSPLLLVNIKTLETLPFSINGLFAYGLTKNTTNEKQVYCFVLDNENGKLKTNLYTIDLDTHYPLQSTFQRLLELSGESLTASVASREHQLVTNLGNFALIAFDNTAPYTLNRSYSLFKQVSFSSTLLLALNYDGSISVHDSYFQFMGILKLNKE